MLENPVARESVKALGVTGAAIIGGPVVSAAVAVLGVGVEALGLLGQRRTKELFDTEELQKIISGIKIPKFISKLKNAPAKNQVKIIQNLLLFFKYCTKA